MGAPTERLSMADPEPVIRRGTNVEYEVQEPTEGLAKGVLIGEEHNAPNFRMRRFTLAPGETVPKHTNAVEHEQYVLDGEYVVGIEDEEYTIGPGDSLMIPAETVHWYRNDSDEEVAFICVVPNGDDEIEVIE
ncbi:MAG: cupin domain-containing protein [Halodesulfurarchaeum sp.]